VRFNCYLVDCLCPDWRVGVIEVVEQTERELSAPAIRLVDVPFQRHVDGKVVGPSGESPRARSVHHADKPQDDGTGCGMRVWNGNGAEVKITVVKMMTNTAGYLPRVLPQGRLDKPIPAGGD